MYILLFVLYSPITWASEGLFGYTYTAETTPAGGIEYEQMQTVRSGKARGKYTAVDLRNELEIGLTDNFQTAIYLNSTYINTENQYDPDNVSQDLGNKNDFKPNGISVEFLYRILSPYKDPFGFAVYFEPEFSLRDHMTGEDKIERAIETRLIFQKNFLDDTLVTAANIMFEPEWEVADGGKNKSELWFQGTIGASYRFHDNWYAGLEFRNHREFPKMNLGNQEHSAFFLGPNIHYGGEKYWATLILMPQIYGTPRNLGVGADGKTITSNYAHLGQHEKFEISLRIGFPFGGEHHHDHE